MKGVAIAALVVLLIACCGIALANPPLVPPVQYEQFCEANKVSGTGIIDASTSIIDKKIALEYYNTMAGDGDFELDSENAYSQNADKLKRNISSVNGGNESNLNLFERTKMTYSGSTPLVGGKYLNSKEFYGGIGAKVQETFSVNEMEKDETSFFASTTPYNPQETTTIKIPCPKDCSQYCRAYPEVCNQQLPPVCEGLCTSSGEDKTQSVTTSISPENIVKDLKNAGRDQDKVAELMGSDPAHLIGIDTKNSFNGTWGTDATWHKIFYKDIKAHELFSGKFEAEKLLKFHENPVPENVRPPCDGIDC
jgi:hypothetical protein